MDTENCLLGKLLGSKCGSHKFHEDKKELQNLSKDELKLLKYRVPNFPQYPTGHICGLHYSKVLVYYSNNQTVCCDPYKFHKKFVSTCLRDVSLELCENFLEAKNVIIPPGNKVCTNCSKKMLKDIDKSNAEQNKSIVVREPDDPVQNEHESQKSTTTTVSTTEYETSTEPSASDESLGFLPESQEQKIKEQNLKRLLNVVNMPLPKRPKLFGERLEKWSENLAHTVCEHVVDEINETYQTNVNISEVKQLKEDSKSLHSMLGGIKTLYEQQTTHSEKIKLLTIFPTHWTFKNIREHVECSSYMVRKANLLQNSHGVLQKPERKKFLHYSEEFVASIEKFYRDNGSIIPGTKECKLVYNRETKQKEMLPRRLLLFSIKELYDKWAQAHLGNFEKIPGFSFFASIKPKDVKLAGDPGTHTVCVCSEHQNVKLKCRALSHALEYRKLLDLCVCSVENEKCMLDNCPNCPGPKAIRDFLVRENLIEPKAKITYFNWTSVNVTSKDSDETQSSSRVTLHEFNEDVEKFTDQFIKDIWSLRVHHFISESQKNYFEYARNNLDYDTGLLMMDFAENHTFTVQNSTQGFYYNNTQATLHPFVLYYRDSTGIVTHASFCVISDCLKHNAYVVNIFQEKVLGIIKQRFPWIKKMIYFSDGAPTQYKNKNNFSNICAHDKDFQIKVISYNFFATSHGKGPCDGIGAVAKRTVRDASLVLPPEKQILDAHSMYLFLNEKLNTTKFIWVSNDECNQRQKKLQKRFELAKTVVNTRSYHCLQPVDEKTAEFKLISFSDKSKIEVIMKQ